MSVFFLAEIYDISDAAMYDQYIEQASSIIHKYGGEYIFRSEALQPVSGNWDVKRVVLIRFTGKEQLQQCFQSEEYRRIVHLREHSTRSKAVIIEDQAIDTT